MKKNHSKFTCIDTSEIYYSVMYYSVLKNLLIYKTYLKNRTISLEYLKLSDENYLNYFKHLNLPLSCITNINKIHLNIEKNTCFMKNYYS